MTTRMLIDARHPEETRVAVLQGNRIEEFDFESADHKQIKGNIYLAKVTRVEPSLQAAFVDFGGNRHGFLAFSEIHPDYYQIPKEDREALLAEEEAHAAEEEALRASEDENDEDESNGDISSDDLDDSGGITEIDTSEKGHVATIEAGHVENGFDYAEDENGYGEVRVANGEDDLNGDGDDDADGEDDAGNETSGAGRRNGRRRQGRGRSKQAEELRAKRMALRRRYKIQDVIHRRQVLLVQVVKEERGNKGAALTSYLSLAGRYCVLMPNSSHGGGISRKISSASDRKRLKAIIGELNLPKSMGCIVRTAGLSRTKTEIKRDFDYLARLWDEIRERTLSSSAPMLIHSDSDLIKRAIRDIYNRDIEEVVVEGEEGYRAARAFMKLLMPSHARRVKAYADPVPLFQRYGAEDQLTAMYDPVVQLKSGGYIVINPTEALVSIDINSGRSTKEYGIEATALNTNLEAAREIARQLRLRDMAGLVVIDFIDMEHGSSVRKVEKAMKDALKNDRARIQVGRISGFGLMEMSRQRLRTGVLEATTRTCPHCDGSGLVRTASSAGLSALRLIEDEAAKGKGSVITLFASTEASIYLLNTKRADLAEIEDRYAVRVEAFPEGENEGAKMRVVSSGPRPESVPRFEPIVIEEDDLDEDDIEEDVLDEDGEDTREEDGDAGSRRRRHKRRRGGRDRQDEVPVVEAADDQAEAEDAESDGEAADAAEREDITGADEDAPRKRRRRGRRRRGGGRLRDDAGEAGGAENAADGEAGDGETYEGDASDANEESAGNDDEIVSEPADAELADDRLEQVTPSEMLAEASVDEPAEVAEPSELAERPVEALTVSDEAAGAAATAAEAPVEEAEQPATPAKRTRRKKPEAEGAEAKAPVKRTRRKKTDVDDGTITAPTETAARKPRTSRRKKAEEATGDEAVAATAPVTTTEVGDAESGPTAAEAPTPAANLIGTAPAPEVFIPEATADDAHQPEMGAQPDPVANSAEPEAPTETPRRGWWQRTFGE